MKPPESLPIIVGQPTPAEVRAARVRLNAFIERINAAWYAVVAFEDVHKIKVLSNEEADRMLDVRHAIANASQCAMGRKISDYEYNLYEARTRWVEQRCRQLISVRKTA